MTGRCFFERETRRREAFSSPDALLQTPRDAACVDPPLRRPTETSLGQARVVCDGESRADRPKRSPSIPFVARPRRSLPRRSRVCGCHVHVELWRWCSSVISNIDIPSAVCTPVALQLTCVVAKERVELRMKETSRQMRKAMWPRLQGDAITPTLPGPASIVRVSAGNECGIPIPIPIPR